MKGLLVHLIDVASSWLYDLHQCEWCGFWCCGHGSWCIRLQDLVKMVSLVISESAECVSVGGLISSVFAVISIDVLRSCWSLFPAWVASLAAITSLSLLEFQALNVLTGAHHQ